MAQPEDRVQLVKRESAAGGGDPADAGAFLKEKPLDPHEDAPEVQGVFFQPPAPSVTKDENVWIGRNASGDLCFKDENNPEVSLTQLLQGILDDVVLQCSGGFVLDSNGDIVCRGGF